MRREDEVVAWQRVMRREEAGEAATGLFTVVRAKVERFMTVVSDKSKADMIDWVFNVRTYRM